MKTGTTSNMCWCCCCISCSFAHRGGSWRHTKGIPDNCLAVRPFSVECCSLSKGTTGGGECNECEGEWWSACREILWQRFGEKQKQLGWAVFPSACWQRMLDDSPCLYESSPVVAPSWLNTIGTSVLSGTVVDNNNVFGHKWKLINWW